MGDLLKMARDLLEEKAPELAPKLTRNLGSGIGLLFRAKHFLLTARPAPFAPWSVQRLLLTPQANPGSLYRCSRSTSKSSLCATAGGNS